MVGRRRAVKRGYVPPPWIEYESSDDDENPSKRPRLARVRIALEKMQKCMLTTD